MISDTLENAQLYESLHDGFKPAFDFLRREDLSTLKAGRYDIDGDNIFALVQEYDSKLLEQGKWETHQVYIDVQFMLEGEELFGVIPADRLTTTIPYNTEKDIEFLAGEGGNMLKFIKNDFLILYQHDAHMPSVAVNEISKKVRKIIIKVRG